MVKLATKLAIVISLLLVILPVQAQDGGLTDEERDLLDRVFIGLDRTSSYASYRLVSTDTLAQSFSLFVGGQTLDIESESIRGEERIFLRGVVGNAMQADVSVNYAETTMGQEESFAMDANVRLVEGVLWVDAAYVDPDADVEPLPEGWTAYLTTDDIPGELDVLDLDSYLGDSPNPFDNRELVTSSVSSITVETITLDDDTELDLITLTFEEEGFRNLFDRFVDPEATADNPFLSVLSSITAEGTITFSIGLTEDNDPLLRETRLDLTFEDLELGTVSDEFPPDAVLDLTLKIEETATLSEVNAEFDEIETPLQ
jgi:hypothetical protein